MASLSGLYWKRYSGGDGSDISSDRARKLAEAAAEAVERRNKDNEGGVESSGLAESREFNDEAEGRKSGNGVWCIDPDLSLVRKYCLRNHLLNVFGLNSISTSND